MAGERGIADALLGDLGKGGLQRGQQLGLELAVETVAGIVPADVAADVRIEQDRVADAVAVLAEAADGDINIDPGALVEFLKKENTAVLLCDALPIPMMIALRETSIQVLGGAKGAPKDRIEDFLNGMLHFDRSGNNGPSCGVHLPDNNKNGTDSDAECDGNISACGTWCH